jgi:hypothetical protein
MTDRYKVYTKALKTLKQMVKLHHPGHVDTLAMMIAGIVLSKKAQLSEMSNEVPVQAKDKSIEMRMRRWVKKEDLDEECIYLPFARQILCALAHLPLLVVMDASQVGRNCMVLMVGVVYKKRALPLVWLVYPGKKGHTSAERHIQVLEKLKALLPEETEVILMGDAETPVRCCFGCTKKPPESMFYALLRRSKSTAHSVSTLSPTCPCRKRASYSTGRLALHKPPRCKLTWWGGGAALMKPPFTCSAI